MGDLHWARITYEMLKPIQPVGFEPMNQAANLFNL